MGTSKFEDCSQHRYWGVSNYFTLVFGQTPVIPGQMVQKSDEIQDLGSYAGQLAKAMASQSYNKVDWHGASKSWKTYEHPELREVEFVLGRVDAVQTSLKPKYIGPFQVIKRNEKTFVLQLPDRIDTFSVDRLKPYFSE